MGIILEDTEAPTRRLYESNTTQSKAADTTRSKQEATPIGGSGEQQLKAKARRTHEPGEVRASDRIGSERYSGYGRWRACMGERRSKRLENAFAQYIGSVRFAICLFQASAQRASFRMDVQLDEATFQQIQIRACASATSISVSLHLYLHPTHKMAAASTP